MPPRRYALILPAQPRRLCTIDDFTLRGACCGEPSMCFSPAFGHHPCQLSAALLALGAPSLAMWGGRRRIIAPNF
jgi:hypothetical protein